MYVDEHNHSENGCKHDTYVDSLGVHNAAPEKLLQLSISAYKIPIICSIFKLEPPCSTMPKRCLRYDGAFLGVFRSSRPVSTFFHHVAKRFCDFPENSIWADGNKCITRAEDKATFQQIQWPDIEVGSPTINNRLEIFGGKDI